MRRRKPHKPISPPAMRHPSGRPVVKEKRGVTSLLNPPNDEPLTPGLRRGDLPEAIGFTAGLTADYDDDEDFDYTREAE